MRNIPPSLQDVLDTMFPSAARIAANGVRAGAILREAISQAVLTRTEVLDLLSAVYHRFPSDPEFEETMLDMEEVCENYRRALDTYEHGRGE